MSQDIVIYWFRQDLRLADNPALSEAVKHDNVLPIYILDNNNPGDYGLGGASQWWLHHSLLSLNESLGGRLNIYSGDPLAILSTLAERHPIKSIYWNRCYEPWRINRDKKIKAVFEQRDIKVNTYNGSLLWEPWTIKNKSGTEYKVFTPFYRKGCLQAQAPREPLPTPSNIPTYYDEKSITVADLQLLPSIRWDKQLEPHWDIGEQGAMRTFDRFLECGVMRYKEGRNFPSRPYVSRMSPYLHFGEVSPNQLWHAVRRISDDQNVDHFCSELGWREFSYSQLYHYPDLPFKNLNNKFDSFPWLYNERLLAAWKKGKTGIPMVDAGMRELWQTGSMHNRVRMIVASFLIKNCLIDWRVGAQHFHDCLCDADLASNSASWQWVAGCGADAAPFFRIFNPVLQGKKFDPDGDYIRKYVPEISRLKNKHLFAPWEAAEQDLSSAGVTLGVNYPKPIVDLSLSRQAALEAYQKIK